MCQTSPHDSQMLKISEDVPMLRATKTKVKTSTGHRRYTWNLPSGVEEDAPVDSPARIAHAQNAPSCATTLTEEGFRAKCGVNRVWSEAKTYIITVTGTTACEPHSAKPPLPPPQNIERKRRRQAAQITGPSLRIFTSYRPPRTGGDGFERAE